MIEYSNQKNISLIQFSIFYWTKLNNQINTQPAYFNPQQCKSWPFGNIVFQLYPMFHKQNLTSKKNNKLNTKQSEVLATNVAIDFDFEYNKRFLFKNNLQKKFFFSFGKQNATNSFFESWNFCSHKSSIDTSK